MNNKWCRNRAKGKVYLQPIRSLGARWGGWSAPRPGRFAAQKDPVPIVQEAGWAQGPVWTVAKNLFPTGIRSPDRPACRESLYRLSYPDLPKDMTKCKHK